LNKTELNFAMSSSIYTNSMISPPNDCDQTRGDESDVLISGRSIFPRSCNGLLGGSACRLLASSFAELQSCDERAVSSWRVVRASGGLCCTVIFRGKISGLAHRSLDGQNAAGSDCWDEFVAVCARVRGR